MHDINAFQAKARFSEILAFVEKGEQFVITRHNRPIAKIIPISDKISSARITQTIQRLQEFREGNKLQGLDWKELRDRGREA